MSKLLVPVSASMPRRPRALSFGGTFEASRRPSRALVTHGGLPTTRSGSGSAPRIADQSAEKKFDVMIAAPAHRRDRSAARATRAWSAQSSTPTTLAARANASEAATRSDPRPHVGSRMLAGSKPWLAMYAQMRRASGGGVWKSPYSIRASSDPIIISKAGFPATRRSIRMENGSIV